MSVSQALAPDVEGYYDSIDTVELGDSVQPESDPLDPYNDPSTESSNGVPTLELQAQYAEELKQIDEEIQTLRQVLYAKCRRQQFLKRQLGITVMRELREDLNRGVDTIRTSEAYQKTTAVVKNVKEKTSAALYDKWNFLKQTNAFKSFEGKLENAYSSVRSKLVRSSTVTSSSPHTTENAADSEAFVIAPHSPSAYDDLNEKDDSPTSMPSPKGTIQLESLCTNDLTESAASEPDASVPSASPKESGDRKPSGQKRRPRQKQ